MKSATIREIELVNYRLFHNAKIRFNPTGKKNISVIQGRNGFGKSNIFNAINWCFFDIEPHLRQESKKLPICNTGTLKELKKGASVQTKVSIILETAAGGKKIERTLVTRKTAQGEHSTTDSVLTVTECIGKEWKIAVNPEYTISRIVPEGMRHFFFIDGEMLRQMFETISPDKIRTAIFELSQVTLLQRAIDHLDALAVSIRKEGGADRDDTLRYAEDGLEITEKNIKELNEQIENDKGELEKARANIRKLNDNLAGIDLPAAQRLEEQRKNTETTISDTEKSLQENKDALRNHLFEVAPAVMLKDAVTQTLSILNSLQKKNKLPPDYQATFIQKLLDQNECICGTDLGDSKNKVKRERLVKLLKECDEPDFLGQATALLYRLEPLRKLPERAVEKIKALETRVSELDTKLIGLQKLLKEIGTKTGNIDHDKVKIIQTERDKYYSIVRTCDAKIGRQQGDLNQYNRQKNDAEKVLRRLMDNQKRFKIIGQRIDACRQAQACLKQIMAKLMNEIRIEAEKGTQKYFAHLVSAKKFSPPQIDNNYNLIVEKDDYNAVTSLSAAETLCMGYSFMSALRETSGFTAPIIIDTPLAKISAEYRNNVATWMKEAIQDGQIVLLVTDVEYTEEFRKAIAPMRADELMLVYNEQGSYSEVENYAK